VWVFSDTSHVVAGNAYHVRGEIVPCALVCRGIPHDECLVPNEISPCLPESLGCGVLTSSGQPDFCVLWESLTSGEQFLVYSLQGFQSGDTVNATAIVNRACGFAGCSARDGCLNQSAFSASGDSGSAVTRVSWGRIKTMYGRSGDAR